MSKMDATHATTRLALALALLPTVALSLQWLRGRAPPREIQNYRKEAAVAIRLARRCGRAMREADTQARKASRPRGNVFAIMSIGLIFLGDAGRRAAPGGGAARTVARGASARPG